MRASEIEALATATVVIVASVKDVWTDRATTRWPSRIAGRVSELKTNSFIVPLGPEDPIYTPGISGNGRTVWVFIILSYGREDELLLCPEMGTDPQGVTMKTQRVLKQSEQSGA